MNAGSARNSTHDEGQGQSIWVFIAAFVALAVVGLAALLIFGTPSGDTRSTKTASDVVPEHGSVTTTSVSQGPSGLGTADSSESSTTTTEAPASSPPSTLPNGDAAPEGTSKVLVTGDSLSLAFQIDPKELGSSPLAVVPPLRAAASGDGSLLAITIDCAQTTREQLAQVSVTESDTSIMVSAVVLVPIDALGCNPTAEPRVLIVPLKRPVGTRGVEVASVGTKLPRIDLKSLSGS
ncbi:MAG: hypothetical protein KDB26_00330 [Microthrixaceae bacterium]|nr:hypothetical protein [Microthrixaceae bacterium]